MLVPRTPWRRNSSSAASRIRPTVSSARSPLLTSAVTSDGRLELTGVRAPRAGAGGGRPRSPTADLRDQILHDLACSSGDAEQPMIAVIAGHPELLKIAHPTVELNHLVGDLARDVAD